MKGRLYERTEYYVAQNRMAVDTALETLAVLEEALRKTPTLEKVLIVEQPPRVDSPKLAELTDLSNFVLRTAAEKSHFSEKISIVTLDALYEYSEKDIYGSPNSSRYDGIHMRGKHGHRIFTNCILTAIKATGTSSIQPTCPSSTSIHTSNIYNVLSN